MISHVHRIFPLLQHTKMWLFIQHESPQQELLLKLLENLYRKLLKIAHIYIRNCSSKFINSSTCSSNYLKWNFSFFYSTLIFVKKIYRISVVEAALRLPPTQLIRKILFKFVFWSFQKSGNTFSRHFNSIFQYELCLLCKKCLSQVCFQNISASPYSLQPLGTPNYVPENSSNGNELFITG